MKKLILMMALVAGVYGQGFSQKNNKIIVTVEHISSTEGSINVDVFNSEKTFLKTPFLSKSRDANTGEMLFEFDGVPNGEYTISIYHDENANGELDKNFMGIPNEPYGVSKEGKSMFGPPSYKEALFAIENNNISLSIALD
jgi:uncharacterized protein (DUF2141 family)